jgi:hypothetical protein
MDQFDQLVTDHEAERTRITDTVNMNLRTIIDRTPAAVLNLSGAATEVANAKRAVETGLSRLTQMTNEIDTATEQVAAKGKTSGAEYNDKKKLITALKTETEKNKELLEIRKAQADSLKTKYASGFHSSYLGLWRPLADETRTALFVLSIVLSLIAIVSLVFFFKDKFISLLPARGAPQPQGTGAFFGGGLRGLIFRKKP